LLLFFEHRVPVSVQIFASGYCQICCNIVPKFIYFPWNCVLLEALTLVHMLTLFHCSR